MAQPEDEPDYDCDVDTAALPEPPLILPILELPQASQARTRARMGVDRGGVLVAKVPSRLLRTIRTPAYVAVMLAAGAREWFQEYVLNCGRGSVFIISYVVSQRLRDMFSSYLFAGHGLIGATGVPVRNRVFTGSAVLKAAPSLRMTSPTSWMTGSMLSPPSEPLVGLRTALPRSCTWCPRSGQTGPRQVSSIAAQRPITQGGMCLTTIGASFPLAPLGMCGLGARTDRS